MRKYLSNVHKNRGEHLQCMNNHYAKFEYKGMKIAGVTVYTNQTPPNYFGWKKCPKFNTPQNEEIFIKCVVKIDTAHNQCMNNHHAKFECKEMKNVGATDYTNRTPSKHFGWKNVSVQHRS